MVSRAQLLELGYTPRAIKHRIANGRIHPVWRGVYAVGRPRLGQHGAWMAAVLTCGPSAVLSHESAAELWGIRRTEGRKIHISVPGHPSLRGRKGIAVHRRAELSDVTTRRGIPVTTPVRTLVDLAPRLTRDALEAAIGEADKRDIVDPERLREELEGLAGRPGVAVLRETLDRRTFSLTESHLERLFLPLARKAGLPPPLTQQRVNGYRVDFYWPDLKLVVETDGLRYHRTPAQQAADRIRDQAHIEAGLTPLRFTHAQIRYDAGWVRRLLAQRAQGPVSTGPLARPSASRTTSMGTP